MINDNNYVTIQGWMRNSLGLSGNELLVYAIIYGFVQDNTDNYHPCSFSYLADWTGASTRTMKTIIADLCDKGLIKKQQVIYRDKITNAYTTTGFTSEKISQVEGKNFTSNSEEISPDHGKNFTGTSEKISHNNTIDNTNNNSIDNRWSKPTIDEIRQYITDKSLNVDAEKFYLYYESNGWMVGRNHMKSWQATVARWSRTQTQSTTYGNNNADAERQQRIADTKRWLAESVVRAEQAGAGDASVAQASAVDGCPF